MPAAVRRRNLVLLVVAQTITSTQSAVLSLGLTFYVFEETGSALAAFALFWTYVVTRR